MDFDEAYDAVYNYFHSSYDIDIFLQCPLTSDFLSVAY